MLGREEGLSVEELSVGLKAARETLAWEVGAKRLVVCLHCRPSLFAVGNPSRLAIAFVSSGAQQ